MEVRDGVGHPDAAFAVLREGARRAHQLGHAGGEGEGLAFEELVGRVLAVALHELRLVVEEVEVRRAARHVQVDDALHLGRARGRDGRRAGLSEAAGVLPCASAFMAMAPRLNWPALAQEMTAGQVLEMVESRIHRGQRFRRVSSRLKRTPVDRGPCREFGGIGTGWQRADRDGRHLGGLLGILRGSRRATPRADLTDA